MNQVQSGTTHTIDDSVLALHNDLRIADLHADSLLWNRDLLHKGSFGHVDLPRLIAGNVALQVFTTVTKTPNNLNNVRNEASTRDNITLLAIAQRWPVASWRSLTERALHQANRLQIFAEKSNNQLRIITSKRDLESLLRERADNRALVGALLGTEGSHALDGALKNVQRLYDAGFRMMSLHHFFDNKLGGSLHGVKKSGLTEFGQAVVKEIERLNIMLDVSHSSEQVVRDVMSITQLPLIVSHTGLHGHCSTPRNISDELMKDIAAAGGLIGMGYWESAICDISPSGIAAAIKAAVDLLGAEHVALGSDFDGAVTTSFDVSEMFRLTDALLKLGMEEKTIRLVMGENQLRFFLQHLPD